MSEAVIYRPSDMSCKPRVLVMIATYNGERYLREQIDSILAQEGVDIDLRICDDCSPDETATICRDYEGGDSRIRFQVNERNLGVGTNFMQMVYEADSSEHDYFAFSDQDDVWLPQKLAMAVDAIRHEEARAGAKALDGFGVPVLYCSDVLNVDESLGNGKRELTSLKIDLSRRATPLLRNIFSGCTMVMDAAMLRLLQSHGCEEMEFPRIHDAWCVMVAYYCGNFLVDSANALILRRITGENTVGAIFPGSDVRKASVGNVFTRPSRAHTRSAAKLLEGYSRFMSADDRELVGSFVSYSSSPWSRVKWAISRQFYVKDWKDDLLTRLKLLFGRY